MFFIGALSMWSILGILFYLAEVKNWGITWWENYFLPWVFLGPVMWIIIGSCYLIGAMLAFWRKIK